MKRSNYINFCNKDHLALGASETIPNLTLPVHELMERLTDHTLDDIRAKSLLHGEYFPVGKDDDVMLYADKMCLAETCIDLTDLSAIKSEVARQIEVMKENFAKKSAPTNAIKSEVARQIEVMKENIAKKSAPTNVPKVENPNPMQ